MSVEAYVAGIAAHLPDRVVTNEALQLENPDWDMAKIASKTGIMARHIASESEVASDLGFAAAVRLIDMLGVDRSTIDVLLYCTQSPDYLLPATACTLQARLGLPTTCAALDFNQGCSGYVYGLYLAKSMVASGMARNVLLITAETYSKFINPRDRSVRVLFGDGGTATLINDNRAGARIGEFALGTDGTGAENLIVPAGGARRPSCAATRAEVTDDQGSTRSEENLYMNGRELFEFTLMRVPEVVRSVLSRAALTSGDVSWFVFHQANAFMNEHLRVKLKVPKEKAPLHLTDYGNTVSNTIPIALCESGGKFAVQDKVMLVGFGVGYSWGACLLEWKPIPLSAPLTAAP